MVRSKAAAALLLSAVLVGACGQITGLSDDYTYDLGAADGAASEGGADGPSDSSSDGVTSDVVTPGDGGDSGPRCTDSQKNVALASMAGMKNDVCKACLAALCCTAVQPCTTQAAGCRVTLSCHLDCSEKGNPQQCFNAQCTNATEPTFQSLRSCATAFCNKDCVL